MIDHRLKQVLKLNKVMFFQALSSVDNSDDQSYPHIKIYRGMSCQRQIHCSEQLPCLSWLKAMAKASSPLASIKLQSHERKKYIYVFCYAGIHDHYYHYCPKKKLPVILTTYLIRLETFQNGYQKVEKSKRFRHNADDDEDAKICEKTG